MSVDFDLTKVNKYIDSYSTWYSEIESHFSKIEEAYEKALEKVNSVLSQIDDDIKLANSEISKCDEQIYQNQREFDEQKVNIESCNYAIEILTKHKMKRDELYAEGKKSSDYTDYDTKISIQENQIKTFLKRAEVHAKNVSGLNSIKTCIQNDISKMESCQSNLEMQKGQIESVLASLRDIGNCLTKIVDLKRYISDNVFPVMKKICLLQSGDGQLLNEAKIDNVEIFKKIKKQLEKTLEVFNNNTHKINESAKYLNNIISDNIIKESNNSVSNINNVLNGICKNLEDKCKRINDLEIEIKTYLNFSNINI